MPVLTFIIEISLLFLFALGIRRIFDKTSIGKAKWEIDDQIFSQQARFLVKMALTSLSWERFVGYILANHGSGRMSDRAACFGIAISYLAYLPTFFFLFILNGILSYSGVFSGLPFLANSESYNSFIYLLMDPGIHGLLVCFALGFFPALILGRSGLAVILSTTFLFPGLISVPGAVLVPVGEILALAFVYWKQAETSGLVKDVRLRVLPVLVSTLLFFILGGLLREFIANMGDSFDPRTRFLKWLFLLGLVFITDLVLSLVITHFVFHKTEAKRNISWWPNRFMISHGWQSLDQVNELATRANERSLRLKQQQESLTADEKSRIPKSVLHQSEAELEKIDYFLRHWEDLQTKV